MDSSKQGTDGQQLCLPLAPRRPAPEIHDAPPPPNIRASKHRLPTELTDAELLTTLLGPASALSCQWLTTKHESFRDIAVLAPADLLEYGFTTGAVHRLSAVFEVAKRYGEREWKVGEPLRGSGNIYAHFR